METTTYFITEIRRANEPNTNLIIECKYKDSKEAIKEEKISKDAILNYLKHSKGTVRFFTLPKKSKGAEVTCYN